MISEELRIAITVRHISWAVVMLVFRIRFFTYGIDAALMENSLNPIPKSNSVAVTSPAISPHMPV